MLEEKVELVLILESKFDQETQNVRNKTKGSFKLNEQGNYKAHIFYLTGKWSALLLLPTNTSQMEERTHI